MVMGSVATGTQVLVIGGGPGGYVAAHRAAQLGKDVILIEQAGLGGVCLHQGCIPSKALIASGGLLSSLEAASERGITVQGVQVDGVKLQAWKRKLIERLEKGVAGLLKSVDVSVIHGKANFVDAHTVDVVPSEPDGPVQRFSFEQCIIATGAVPRELPELPFDGQRVIGAKDALEITDFPASMAVIGGGYIGVELGMMMRALGVKVTIIEATETLMPGVDTDLVAVLLRRLRRLNVDIVTNAMVTGLTPAGVVVDLGGGKDQVIPADKILLAVGRRPHTAGLGLEAAGIAADQNGFIPVDGQCRTGVSHIYAVGDVTKGPMLAHRASKQGTVAAEAICGLPSGADWVAVPAVVYTDPEVAMAGLTEAEAKAAGYEVQIGKVNFVANGRALTRGQSDGFVKVIAEKGTGVILGVHMIGPEVSELIAGAVLALEMAATVEDVAAAVHPHPTLSEAFMEAAQQLFQL